MQDKNGSPSSVPDILRFRATINEIVLFDLPLLNRSFTWTNGRRSPTLERLDRAFVSLGWLSAFPKSSWRALPRPRSDHTPLVLSASSFIPSASIFRFESFWLRYPSLATIVSDAWSSATSAASSVQDPISRFQAKITNVQRALKIWSVGLTTAIKIQSDLCLSWIDWLDKAEECRTLSGLECHLRTQLKERFEELAVQEEIKWRQRSRVLWLLLRIFSLTYFVK